MCVCVTVCVCVFPVCPSPPPVLCNPTTEPPPMRTGITRPKCLHPAVRLDKKGEGFEGPFFLESPENFSKGPKYRIARKKSELLQASVFSVHAQHQAKNVWPCVHWKIGRNFPTWEENGRQMKQKSRLGLLFHFSRLSGSLFSHIGSEQKRPGAKGPPEFVPESPLQKGVIGSHILSKESEGKRTLKICKFSGKTLWGPLARPAPFVYFRSYLAMGIVALSARFPHFRLWPPSPFYAGPPDMQAKAQGLLIWCSHCMAWPFRRYHHPTAGSAFGCPQCQNVNVLRACHLSLGPCSPLTASARTEFLQAPFRNGLDRFYDPKILGKRALSGNCIHTHTLFFAATNESSLFLPGGYGIIISEPSRQLRFADWGVARGISGNSLDIGRQYCIIVQCPSRAFEAVAEANHS